jgi:glycosyltransferase involved in cell wall biosynthesis
MKPSMSVIVPAFNEQDNLRGVVNETKEKLKHWFHSYEFIIINDGSTDRTSEVSERLAKEDPYIRVVHHARNKGLGYSLREGYDLAEKEFVMWTPGDHGMLGKSLDALFGHVGDKDIVIPFLADPRFRSLPRRFISRVYVTMFNVLFGLNLLYYNGPHIYRTKVIQSARTTTFGFAFFAEALVLLIKGRCSYVEVPTYHQKRTSGSSKAFTIKNIVEILRTVVTLFWDIRVNGRTRFTKSTNSQTPS